MNNINICLWNWKDYNNGIDNWKWFTLPEDAKDMYGWIEDLYDDGKEEIFICDSEHSFIDESTSLEGLIELSYCEHYEIIELSSYEPPYEIDMLDDMMERYSPSEIVNMVHFGEYRPSHSYFTFDGAGNIETLSDTDYERQREDAFNEGALEFLADY